MKWLIALAGVILSACSQHSPLEEDSLPLGPVATQQRPTNEFASAAQEARALHFWREYAVTPEPDSATSPNY
jgi:hypothetical protein